MYQKLKFGFIIFLLVTIILIISDSVTTTEQFNFHETNKMIGKGITKFAFDLYQATIRGTTGNIVISPLSTQICLSLLYVGSAGHTAHILRKVLGYNRYDQSAIAPMFHNLLKPLHNTTSLAFASALYVSQDFSVNRQFEQIAENDFYSHVGTIDARNRHRSARLINDWVKTVTHNMINDLIGPSDISESDGVILVNGIYFNGKWKYPFNPIATYPQEFQINCLQNKYKKIPMMHIVATFKYGYILNAAFIEIPYKNDDISMVILLPNQCDGLAQLEQQITTFNFNDLDKYAQGYMETVLQIPRFKISTKVNFNEALKSMGLRNIFSRTANFSQIVRNNDQSIDVSSIVQQALIDVNECGSQATAAIVGETVQFPGMPSMPDNQLIFNVNSPFLYFIKKSSEILFIGRFME